MLTSLSRVCVLYMLHCYHTGNNFTYVIIELPSLISTISELLISSKVFNLCSELLGHDINTLLVDALYTYSLESLLLISVPVDIFTLKNKTQRSNHETPIIAMIRFFYEVCLTNSNPRSYPTYLIVHKIILLLFVCSRIFHSCKNV